MKRGFAQTDVGVRKDWTPAKKFKAEDEVGGLEPTDAGTFTKNNGKFGFIKQDSGEADMFVLPVQCVGFGGVLPAIGTRVVYAVTTDPKTHRPRADSVHPEDPDAVAQEPVDDLAVALAENPEPEAVGEEGVATGEMHQIKGSFGFIKQDSLEPDMFVMPSQCAGFGGRFPPLGCRVSYSISADPKTGRPRAENVHPLEEEGKGFSDEQQEEGEEVEPEEVGDQAGRIVLIKGGVGFIAPDDGGEDILVVPAQCLGFQGALPAVNTRVTFTSGSDSNTGVLCAERVFPERRQASSASLTGTMEKADHQRFGFIKQDNGEEDMFVMPMQCAAFGLQLPPLGTRVRYEVTTDSKSGRPRAENVKPLNGAAGARQHSPAWRTQAQFPMMALGWRPPMMMAQQRHSQPYQQQHWQPTQQVQMWRPPMAAARGPNAGRQRGTMDKTAGSYGFIKQDSGEADMFVMPTQCIGFDGAFPPMGTRVMYEVTVDAKTGRPRAENVYPEEEAEVGAIGEQPSGTVSRIKEKFGFIKQDVGGEDMFFMPTQCVGFDGQLPPEGTRVTYTVVTDAKSGKPRAEEVMPEEEGGGGAAPAQQARGKGKGKDWGAAKGQSKGKCKGGGKAGYGW